MTLAEERDFVFAHKPVFGALYQKYAHSTWLEYAATNYPHKVQPSHPTFTSRFAELEGACRTMSSPLFGSQLTDRIIDSLRHHRFVSTAEHHGILCNPFFLNSALLRTHYEPELPAIALTCGGVSFSNSSYPRGLTYHDEQLAELKIPLVPWKFRQCPVYGHEALSQSEMTHALHQIQPRHHAPALEKRLTQLIDLFCADPKLFDLPNYSDQCSYLTHVLWKQCHLLGDVIYLEIESMVSELLSRYHLNQNTFIHRLLFDRHYRSLYITHFKGVSGAHADIPHGTHLFWYIDHQRKRRVSLFEYTGQDGIAVLRSRDGTIAIFLTPSEIGKHIADHTIFPCLALCYSMISFYYGIILGGGFSQIQYLQEMRDAYMRVIDATHDIEGDICTSLDTDIFTGEFVFTGITDGNATVAASLLDVYLWGNQTTNAAHSALFQTLTVGKSLDMMMPQLAHIISNTHPLSNSDNDFPASLHVHT